VYLLEEDTASSILVGETEGREIFELSDGSEDPIVDDKVQIQERQE
jgi:hypothetical protein